MKISFEKLASLCVLLQSIFQILRWLLYYQQENIYLKGTVVSVCLIQLITICVKHLANFQMNCIIYFILMYVTIILSQFEAIKHSFDNVYQNFIYCLFFKFAQDLNLLKQNYKSKISIIILIVFWSGIIISFSLKIVQSDLDTVDIIMKIINQKLNLLVFILLLFNYYKKQNNSPDKTTSRNEQEEKIITNKSNFQVMNTDRKESIILPYYQDESKHLLEHILEGIIFIQLNEGQKCTTINDVTISFQNEFSKLLFQAEENELLELFLNTESEIKHIESKHSLDSSIFSLQSLAQLQMSSFKIQPQIRQKNYSLCSPRLQSRSTNYNLTEINTIWKTIQYVFLKKTQIVNKYDIVVLEGKFKIQQKIRLVEIIILLGSDNSLILLCRDIGHREKIQHLYNIDQQKSKTLFFVCHEYRSPLNAILNILDRLINNNQLPIEFKDDIQILLENSHYMLNLSNDILDLAQMNNDMFTLNKQRVNLSQIGEECLKLFKIHAQQKGNTIKVVSSSSSLYIHSDKRRIKQILFNLIANSLKFTLQGQIQICFRQYGEFVDIGVKDTGIGISLIDQNKLFKAFSKIMDSQNQKLNEQGVGLGLLISNKLAQQITHDGSGIQIQSNTSPINHGSYFYFTVLVSDFHSKAESVKVEDIKLFSQTPKLESYRQMAQNFTFKDQGGGFNCNHILIVDDNAFNLFTFENILKNISNCQIDKAYNGQEAVEKVKNKKCSQNCIGYKAIFMDLEMPLMNGLQASKVILDFNKNQKIFIVTGYEDPKEDLYAKQIGVQLLLTKPINREKLTNVIKQYKLQ